MNAKVEENEPVILVNVFKENISELS